MKVLRYRRVFLPQVLVAYAYFLTVVYAFRRQGVNRPFALNDDTFTSQIGVRDDSAQPVRLNSGGVTRPSQDTVFTPGMEDLGTKFDAQFSLGESATNQIVRFPSAKVNAQQTCPGMIGPKSNGVYYCVSRVHGYCDRRSGTCRCFPGYQGLDCNSCSMDYYDVNPVQNQTSSATPVPGLVHANSDSKPPMHISNCQVKTLCPKGCSGAGTCDYATGTCSCREGRKGIDCSTPACTNFGRECELCQPDRCLSCKSGYYLNDDQMSCQDCTVRFDHRCAECNKDKCLKCADQILTSALRSGSRAGETIHSKEYERTFPKPFRFGTQNPEFFDAAEAYYVAVDNSDRQECSLTKTGWECNVIDSTPLTCGHHGTIAFSSPTYAVSESADLLWVAVSRSGEGMGTASVEYRVQEDTSNEHHHASSLDVSSTSRFTSNQTLVFNPGVVSLTFPITIHDDRTWEQDETFLITLHSVQPSGLATLGSQHTARVTILDDDFWKTSPFHSQCTFSSENRIEVQNESLHHDYLLQSEAGETVEFSVSGLTAVGNNVVFDPDPLLVQVWEVDDPLPTWALKRESNTLHAPLLQEHLFVHRSQNQYSGGCIPTVDPLKGIHEYDCRYMSSTATPQSEFGRLLHPSQLSGLGDQAASPPQSAIHIGKHLALSVQFAIPGGLSATTWHSIPREGQIPLAGTVEGRVDAIIDFQIKNVDRKILFPKHAKERSQSRMGNGNTFSILWQGGLLPSVNSMCNVPVTLQVKGTGGIVLWYNNRQVADLWHHGSQNSDFLYPLTTEFDCNQVVPITLQYRNIHSEVDVQLLWKLESELDSSATLIPSETLHYLRHVGKSPYPMIVKHSSLSAEHSEVIGIATWKGRVGKPNYFRILPRDSYGNLFTHGDIEQVQVTASHDTQGTEISGSVKFSEDRSCLIVEYNPIASGQYTLQVTMSGQHVIGSPFALDVFPSTMDVSRSEFVWLTNGPNGGVNVATTFEITSRDVYGNIRDRTQDTFGLVVMHTTLEWSQEATITAVGNGRYSGSITPAKSGVYQTLVFDKVQCERHLGTNQPTQWKDCAALFGSPFTFNVLHGQAESENSVGTGQGLATATSGVVATFQVTMYDEFGNLVVDTQDVTVGDTIRGISLTLDHVDGSQQQWTVDDAPCVYQGAGEYLCSYIPDRSSLQGLDDKVAKLSVIVEFSPSGTQTILGGKPFDVEISDGSCSGSQSIAYGDVIEGNVELVVGQQVWFEIQARDGAGNNITNSLESGCVFSGSLESSTIISETHQLGAASLAFDSIVDKGQGVFRVFFTPQVSTVLLGATQIVVTETGTSGEPLGSSPFSIIVFPSKPQSAESIVWGTGLESGVAGIESNLYVQLRDSYGNNRTGTSDTVWFEWYDGLSEETVPLYRYQGVPINNGIYDGSFTPTMVPHLGRLIPKVKLASPGGINAEYFQGSIWDPMHARRDGTRRIETSLEWEWDHPVPAIFSGYLSVRSVNDKFGFLVRVSGGGVRVWCQDHLLLDTLTSYEHDPSMAEFRVLSPVDASEGTLVSLQLEFGSAKTHGHPKGSLSLRWLVDNSLDEKYPGPFIGVPILQNELYNVETISNGLSPIGAQYVSSVGFGPKTTLSVLNPLHGIRVGFESNLPVTVHDEYGNQAWSCNDTIVVGAWYIDRHFMGNTSDAHLEYLSPEGFIDRDSRTGGSHCIDGSRYIIPFVPTLSGKAIVFASVNPVIPDRNLGRGVLLDELEQTLVQGTPIHVDVSPGISSPRNATATGIGLFVAVAGVPAEFLVQPRDAHGNRQTAEQSNDIFVADLIPEVDTLRDLRDSSKMTTRINGQHRITSEGYSEYLFEYILEASGTYMIQLSGKAGEIEDASEELLDVAPFQLIVAPHVMDPRQSRVSDVVQGSYWGLDLATEFWIPSDWLGSTFEEFKSVVATIRVEARDKFGNLQLSGGDAMSVQVIGASPSNISTLSLAATSHVLGIVDNRNGTYDVYILHGDPLRGVEPGGRDGTVEVHLDMPFGPALDSEPLNEVNIDSNRGGLQGDYYTVRDFTSTDVVPALSRVDEIIDIESIHRQVYPDFHDDHKQLPVSVLWRGYIKSEHHSNLVVSLSHSSKVQVVELRVGTKQTVYNSLENEQPIQITSVELESPVAGMLYPIQISITTLEPSHLKLLHGSEWGVGESDFVALDGVASINIHSSVLRTELLQQQLQTHATILITTSRSEYSSINDEYKVVHVDSSRSLAYLDRTYEGIPLENAIVWKRATDGLVPQSMLFVSGNGMRPIRGSPVLLP